MARILPVCGLTPVLYQLHRASALHLPPPGFRSVSHNVVNGDENVVIEAAEIRILSERSHEAE